MTCRGPTRRHGLEAVEAKMLGGQEIHNTRSSRFTGLARGPWMGSRAPKKRWVLDQSCNTRSTTTLAKISVS